MDPERVDADVNTAPAPEAPARPAPDAVPSVEPLHGPMDTAEDSLDGLQTAFGALSVKEVVSQPQPVKRKRENESEKDAGEGADEGEEQGQDPTDVPTFEGAPSASGLQASPSPITTTLPAATTSTSTTNLPMAEGTGFTGMPPYPAYGMGPPTTALHEATTASEPVASSAAPRWYAADRDAGSNSHEFARIRIRPEFARIRGPLRIRIRNFKFEFPLDSLEFPRGLESIGTYNLPSPVCICPLPYGIKHFKSKSFHNLAIFVVCCCLHSPCLNYLTKIKTNQNEEFQISMYTPFLDSFEYLLEKKQQSMQNHPSTHKPSHVNHFLPLLGLHSLYSCIESWDLNSSKGEDNKYKGNIKQTSNGHSINIIIVMMLNNHHYVTVTVHCQIWTFSNLVTRISLRARSRRGQGVYQNEG